MADKTNGIEEIVDSVGNQITALEHADMDRKSLATVVVSQVTKRSFAGPRLLAKKRVPALSTKKHSLRTFPR